MRYMKNNELAGHPRYQGGCYAPSAVKRPEVPGEEAREAERLADHRRCRMRQLEAGRQRDRELEQRGTAF